MALAALNQITESTLKTLSYGVQGWIQNSVVTWVSTAVAFHGVKLARDYNYTTIKDVEAAKFALLACTIHSVMQGIFSARKELDVEKLLNKQWIAFTNTAVLTFYGAYRLKIALNIYSAFGVTTLSYIATKMVYNTYAEKEK